MEIIVIMERRTIAVMMKMIMMIIKLILIIKTMIIAIPTKPMIRIMVSIKAILKIILMVK